MCDTESDVPDYVDGGEGVGESNLQHDPDNDLTFGVDDGDDVP